MSGIKDKTKFNYFSLLLVSAWLIYAVIYVFFGEKVPVNNGFGWDGNIYGSAVKDFPAKLLNKEFLNLHMERILPSAILYGIFKLFNIGFTNENIIYGFDFLNILAIFLSTILWIRISKIVQLNQSHEFLGTVAILITAPVLKIIPYDPVLTDAITFCLGFITLYGFLTDNKKLMFLALVFATFIWPVAALGIPILLIFNKSKQFEIGESITLNKWLMIAGIVVLNLMLYYFFFISDNLNDQYPAYRRRAPGQFDVLNVIIGILSLDIYIVLAFGFLNKINIFSAFKKTFAAINIPFLIGCLLFIVSVRYYFSTFPKGEYMKMSWYIIELFASQSLQPFSNVIFMVLYFGPLIYLLMFRWKLVVENANAMGIGFMLFFIANLIQCFDGESRHAMFFYPFLIFLALFTLRDVKLNGWFTTFFLITAFVFSKVWFRINTDEFVNSIMNDEVLTKEVHQRFFWYIGHYMNYKLYLLQTPFVILAGILLYRAYRRRTIGLS